MSIPAARHPPLYILGPDSLGVRRALALDTWCLCPRATGTARLRPPNPRSCRRLRIPLERAVSTFRRSIEPRTDVARSRVFPRFAILFVSFCAAAGEEQGGQHAASEEPVRMPMRAFKRAAPDCGSESRHYRLLSSLLLFRLH
jgi:hypothetical protein